MEKIKKRGLLGVLEFDHNLSFHPSINLSNLFFPFGFSGPSDNGPGPPQPTQIILVQSAQGNDGFDAIMTVAGDQQFVQ